MDHFYTRKQAPLLDWPEVFSQHRGEDPVHLDSAGDFVAMFRHKDVAEVLSDERTFTSEHGALLGDSLDSVRKSRFVLTTMNGALHSALRNAATPLLSARAAQFHRNAILEQASARASALSSNFDFVEAFAIPFTAEAFARAFDMERHAAEMQAALVQATQFFELPSSAAARCGHVPARDLPTILEDAMTGREGGVEEEGSYWETIRQRAAPNLALSDGDISHLLAFVMLAGFVDVALSITQGVHSLMDRADLRETFLFGSDREMSMAVRELVRFAPTTHYLRRTAVNDLSRSGQDIPAGSKILAVIASANRDELVFSQPDQIDFKRSDIARSLSFGTGPHSCPGYNLGILMIAMGLKGFLSHVHQYRVDETRSTILHKSSQVGYTKLFISL